LIQAALPGRIKRRASLAGPPPVGVVLMAEEHRGHGKKLFS